MPETTLIANVRKIAEGWPGITRVVSQVDPRPIAGTDKPSEHTFGNAADIYGSRKAMSTLAAHLNATKKQTGVRIVCYDGGPGPSYDKCTTKHIDHIHVDMVPNCAGIVPASGTARERRDKCEEYQKGRGVTVNPNGAGGNLPGENTGGSGDGFLGIPGAIDRFTQSVGNALQTGLFVTVGIVVLGAGIVLALKDAAVNVGVKSALKSVTKGVTK